MSLQVQSLALLSGLRIWHCREIWCRPAAVALIGSLAWEPPYEAGAALKSKKKKNKNKNKKKNQTLIRTHKNTNESQMHINYRKAGSKATQFVIPFI